MRVNWTIYALFACGLTVVPATLGAVYQSQIVFFAGVLSAIVSGFIVFIAFARAETARMNAELERLDAEWQNADADENGFGVNLREQTINELLTARIDNLWEAELKKLLERDIDESELPAAYCRTVLRLYDEMDMQYAEKVAGFRFSKVLWLMARSPYNFRKFCKALGK